MRTRVRVNKKGKTMIEQDFLDILNENKCLIDVLYSNSYSESDDWLDNYSICDNYLKKYLYYRFSCKDGIDIDACEYVMPLYVALSSNIFSEYNYIKEVKKGSQYEILVNNANDKSYLRGDTAINAMSAIVQIFEYITGKSILKPNKNNCSDVELRMQYKECVKLLETEEYSKILELLNTHIKLCYSFGNFYPLIHKYREYSLNARKDSYYLNGYLKKFDDAMSEWLQEMKNCLEEREEFTQKKYREKLDSTYSFWIEEYKKRKGWLSMVEDFCFAPFLNKNEPIVFWSVTKENFLIDFVTYLEKINYALAQRQEMIQEKIRKEMRKKGLYAKCENLFDS